MGKSTSLFYSYLDPHRQLAMQGAEIIFMPIWGGNLTLARARAIENQVYLVSSSYDMATGVFDLEGELIVEADEQNPVVNRLIINIIHIYFQKISKP